MKIINKVIRANIDKFIRENVEKCSKAKIEHLRNKARMHCNATGDDDLYAYYSYDYIPKNSDIKPTPLDKKIQHKIWVFKHEKGCDKAVEAEYKEIVYDDVLNNEVEVFKNIFGDCTDITLATVPCSSKENNTRRWKKFSKDLSKRLGMENAFGHIRITQDATTASHYCGRRTMAKYELDKSFFKGKAVVIFDDLATEGYHIEEFSKRLKDCGAEIIMAIVIAKTKQADDILLKIKN